MESDKAKGATVSFSQNRLQENGTTWNTKGAFGYRIAIARLSPEPGGSAKTVMIPAVTWNVSKLAGYAGNDIEELKFNLSLSTKVSPACQHSCLWVIGMSPYYLTDFSFEDEIYGIAASAEYIGKPFGSALYLGGFTNIKPARPGEGVQYQLKLVPKLDYSVTGKGGIHTSRVPGDDWFCMGGSTSLDFRFSTEVPLQFGVTCEYMGVLSGKASNVHLFTPSGMLWLDHDKNIALKFSYSKGKTLQTARKVDLLTLGVELKH
ncbi:MAG: hypothetical protein HGA97_05740 [Chlorobiaceae bacterium]|nr:hypothetical protein [Chlorobiaceae bacterium]